ncbi:hypothetical protein KDL44_03500 [bacterium]|nr:hypothetical protein [bacterium]
MTAANYSYHPFHTIGGARLSLFDEAAANGAGAWQPLGRVADAEFRVESEKLDRLGSQRGTLQPVAQFCRSLRHSLSFRLLEQASPLALGLLAGPGAVVSGSSAGTEQYSEILRLHATDWTELLRPWALETSPAATLRSYDGLVTYGSPVDYELDYQRGLIRRSSGSAIGEGQPVVLSATVRRQAVSETAIGAPDARERYHRVLLQQLATDGGDPAGWRETGLEFEFSRVSTVLPGQGISFSEEQLGEGVALDWDCMYDPASGNVGLLRSAFAVLELFGPGLP